MFMTYDLQISEEQQNSLEDKISQQLRRLYIPGNLKGHRCLIVAISQVAEDPRRIDYITKELYPDIATMLGMTSSKVERAIRTAIKRCWEKGGREELEKLAGFHLQRCPTNSDFIDLVASCFRR